jgi:peptide/nickel transport system permease protein
MILTKLAPKLTPINKRVKNNDSYISKLKDFVNRKNFKLMLGIGTVLFFLVMAFIFTPYNPNKADFYNRLASPSGQHWFGTDHLGRDIATRMLYGSGYSLGLALLVSGCGAIIGTTLGLIAGILSDYKSNSKSIILSYQPYKFVDQWIMRITDSFFAFPELVAAIAISGLLGASTGNMLLALILLSWMKYCRLTRSLTIAICQEDFIVQARLNKLPVYLILWRHVLVNIRLQVIVLFTSSWSKTILAISGLSFLGFGVQPPNAEWGAMLLDGKVYMQSAPHVMVFPGIAILISVLSINLIGDWLHDKMDK